MLGLHARMAELVDALASGASVHLYVEVQVLFRAPRFYNRYKRVWFSSSFLFGSISDLLHKLNSSLVASLVLNYLYGSRFPFAIVPGARRQKNCLCHCRVSRQYHWLSEDYPNTQCPRLQCCRLRAQPSVITSGDPQRLIDLVEGICHDFEGRAQHYKSALCTGASIGAGLCFEMQRRFPIVKYGIYAGAGVSPPENIFEAPLFYFARKKFTKHGFDARRLKEAWSKIDIVPERPLNFHTPFVVALGLNDKIVKYDKALTTFKAWEGTGKPIQIITVPKTGHIGIIRWYKHHFEGLLSSAEVQLVD